MILNFLTFRYAFFDIYVIILMGNMHFLLHPKRIALRVVGEISFPVGAQTIALVFAQVSNFVDPPDLIPIMSNPVI